MMQATNKCVGMVAARVLTGICLLAGTLQASIGIRPAFVEVNLDEGRPSGTFLISNLGDTEERFRVNAVHFTYTEKGVLQASPTGKHSLAPFIRFNPRELTLAPKTQRAVRFAIIPRGKLAEGEHWAAMELESLAVNEAVSKDEKTGRSVRLKTVTTIMAPIFGSVGKTSYSGTIDDVQVEAGKDGATVLKTLISTTGSGRLGIIGSYEILDASGATVSSGPLGSAYVLRGAQRWLTRRIDTGIPNQQYTVKVSFAAAHLEQPLAKEAVVTWPEPVPTDAPAATEPAAQAASEETKPDQPPPKDGDRQEQAQGRADN